MGSPGKIENLRSWEPGQSWNPGGRPKKRPITERYAQFAEFPVDEKTRKALKLPEGATMADAAVKRAYQGAIAGNLDALKEIREANPGPPPKSQTRTFKAQGEGVRVSVEGIGADGSRVAHAQLRRQGLRHHRFGKTGGADTIAFKRIDAFTFEATLKKASKVVVTNQLVVSKNGKVMTLNAKGTTASGQPVNDVVVFDRQ